MPYINVKLSKKFDDVPKNRMAAAMAEKITIIPGKEPIQLMSTIEDGVMLHRGGKPAANAAFVEIRCFGKAEPQYNEQFALEVYKLLETCFGIRAEDVYLNFNEQSWWGAGGTVKTT